MERPLFWRKFGVRNASSTASRHGVYPDADHTEGESATSRFLGPRQNCGYRRHLELARTLGVGEVVVVALVGRGGGGDPSVGVFDFHKPPSLILAVPGLCLVLGVAWGSGHGTGGEWANMGKRIAVQYLVLEFSLQE